LILLGLTDLPMVQHSSTGF